MQEALEQFVEYWKTKKHVEGILLTGSYAVGLESKSSDIDMRLIFSSKYKKSIKGLTIINGYLFSYLGSSINISRKKLATDFINKNKFEARIFSIGKIMYDKNSDLLNLKELAETYLKTPFIEKKLNDEEIKINMYSLYSNKVYLQSIHENSSFFLYHYYNFLRQSLRFYSKFLGYEFFIDSKIEKILTENIYRTKYGWQEFPDQKFVRIWLKCIDQKNANKKSLISIYNYLEQVIIKINEKKFTISWND